MRRPGAISASWASWSPPAPQMTLTSCGAKRAATTEPGRLMVVYLLDWRRVRLMVERNSQRRMHGLRLRSKMTSSTEVDDLNEEGWALGVLVGRVVGVRAACSHSSQGFIAIAWTV